MRHKMTLYERHKRRHQKRKFANYHIVSKAIDALAPTATPPLTQTARNPSPPHLHRLLHLNSSRGGLGIDSEDALRYWYLTRTNLHKVSLRCGGDLKVQKSAYRVFGWPERVGKTLGVMGAKRTSAHCVSKSIFVWR